MPQITLYDPENQNTYNLDVTEADARRANKSKKNILYKKQICKERILTCYLIYV